MGRIKKKCIDYVDPFIGSSGNGHALVGPQMPHGMVKLGPDTITLPCGGYEYKDNKIIGFSHTHLEGVGGSGGRGNILVTATTGELKSNELEYASKYSHNKESAKVGYYQVFLNDYGINVELTANRHAGLHRYTFPLSNESHILIDPAHTLGKRNNCNEVFIEIINKNTISGYSICPVTPGSKNVFKVYFYVELSKAFDNYSIWDGEKIYQNIERKTGDRAGISINYETKNNDQILVKVGLSYIDSKQAKDNLYKEIPNWDFNEIRLIAERTWERLLSRVKVEGNQEDLKKQFYSSLYRALNQPTDYSEYGRYICGQDGELKVYECEERGFYLDDWALWDTFRSTHPLQTLIEPEIKNDMVWSLIEMYKQSGWYPNCTSPENGINQTMIGHNAVSVIVDAYYKGFREYDSEKAYEGMKKVALEEHPNPNLKLIGTTDLYRKLGYYPRGEEDSDEDTFSVSITLELSYAEWCTAMMAKALGKTKDYEYFIKKANNYKNLFDTNLGFMRQKHTNGKWVDNFNPADSFKNGFCECSSWEYTFFVPHDLQGLTNLIGGKRELDKKLDAFFEGSHFNYQNETSIQVPYLYNLAGQPWKTQEVINFYMKNKFNSSPEGLYGEDDAGAMSAWHAFNLMGFYPICPGQPYYMIGVPMFEELVLDTYSNKKFVIKAKGVSKGKKYIKFMKLNGKKLNRIYLTHEDIIHGGELIFEMDYYPNKKLLAEEKITFPSLTKEMPLFDVQKLVISKMKIEANEPFKLIADIVNIGATGGKTLDVYANDEIVTSKNVFIEKGIKKQVDFEVCLYKEDVYSIRIGDESINGVRLNKEKPVKIIYSKVISLSKHFIRAGLNEKITASCIVKNIGSFNTVESIILHINHKKLEMKNVAFAPGEKKEVEFEFLLGKAGIYEVQIGKSDIKKVYVGDKPNDKWEVNSTTKADYYECGDHIFIFAKGNEEKREYGTMYLKRKVKGDFKVITKISNEDNTSPYAPAGIILKNDLSTINDKEGFISIGAMSKRGYFFRHEFNDSEYILPYRSKIGCPETPYWFKIERKKNYFIGYYSINGAEWKLMNEIVCNRMNEEINIGLFVNSSSPDLRMVEFDFLNIEKFS